MNTRQTPSQPSTPIPAFSGILFPILFGLGDFLRARLATLTAPLPSAPAAETMRYVNASQLEARNRVEAARSRRRQRLALSGIRARTTRQRFTPIAPSPLSICDDAARLLDERRA